LHSIMPASNSVHSSPRFIPAGNAKNLKSTSWCLKSSSLAGPLVPQRCPALLCPARVSAFAGVRLTHALACKHHDVAANDRYTKIA
jgi:hypothetical protein